MGILEISSRRPLSRDPLCAKMIVLASSGIKWLTLMSDMAVKVCYVALGSQVDGLSMG